ncbi:6028_t:CDS:2 [Cetraspora pellucida]|uniref:6028_t:CDS:1 n=1 Tax=Cetraspora pellucida TaxID=1433469 RepID=A0A9N9NRG1_9GLOM|nr:6028_t:CDS:2 [Cetraspora pellucida]
MSNTINNNTRYRYGCMGPGYKTLNGFVGKLFRKISSRPYQSNESQETTDNPSLTNSHSTNSITNHKTFNVGIQAPNKAKVKPDRKGKYVMSEASYNEQPGNSSLPSQRNRSEDIYNLNRKVDALGAQLTQIEQTLNTLVQIRTTQNNSANIIINTPSQSSKISNDHIHYCTKCGHKNLLDEWTKWNTEKNDWERYSNVDVALKSLSEFKDEDFTSGLFEEVIIFTPALKVWYTDVTFNLNIIHSLIQRDVTRILNTFLTCFIKALKSHLTSNNQVSGRFTTLRTYGMTYDPKLKAYMMVMTLADYGDLSAYLKKEFSTLSYIHKLEILYDIATGICQIHKSGLVHRDLHSRNVMCQGIKNRSLGRGENHRFVIGKRPDIVPNTPKLYADLMQRCWCGNKEKRPSAFELYMTIGTWLNQCLFVPDSEITKRFKKGDEHSLKIPQSQSLHPENVLYSTYHKTLPLNPVNSTMDSYNSISDYDDDYLFMTITDTI